MDALDDSASGGFSALVLCDAVVGFLAGVLGSRGSGNVGPLENEREGLQ